MNLFLKPFGTIIEQERLRVLCHIVLDIEMSVSLYLEKKLCNDERISDQMGGSDRSDFLTINESRKCVSWYSSKGNKIIRLMTFPSNPLTAIFCCFQSKGDLTNNDDFFSVQNAIAVMISDTDLRIQMFSHEVYSIKLQFPVRSMVSTPFGLLFRKKVRSEGYELGSLLQKAFTKSTPKTSHDEYFILSNPSSPLVPVRCFNRW